jgi:hypothetical protein
MIEEVTVEDFGSVVLYRPHTRAARDWLMENADSRPWQWFGGTLTVEHRFAEAISMGLLEAGFELQIIFHNGRAR